MTVNSIGVVPASPSATLVGATLSAAGLVSGVIVAVAVVAASVALIGDDSASENCSVVANDTSAVVATVSVAAVSPAGTRMVPVATVYSAAVADPATVAYSNDTSSDDAADRVTAKPSVPPACTAASATVTTGRKASPVRSRVTLPSSFAKSTVPRTARVTATSNALSAVVVVTPMTLNVAVADVWPGLMTTFLAAGT